MQLGPGNQVEGPRQLTFETTADFVKGVLPLTVQESPLKINFRFRVRGLF